MESVEIERLLQYREKLVNYISGKVFDRALAEDILQDSLVKAYRASEDLRDDEKLIPWFYRIINNIIVDTYRRKEVESRYLEAYARDKALSLTSQDETELCACFRELLPTLKPEYAALIESLELSPGDPEQVAEELAISRNNLKVRRHRARQALRQRLEETCRICAVHGCLDCTCQAVSN